MANEELKNQVTAALEALTEAIAAARAAGVQVNLWVNGTGPTSTGPSEIGLDFGS